MLIRNHQAKIVAIPLPGGMERIKLGPGVNEVDAKQWEQVEQYQTVKRMLDHQDGDGTLSKVSGTSFASLPAKEALKTIPEVMHLPILRDWVTKEKRPNIAKAIQTQISRILTPAAKNTPRVQA